MKALIDILKEREHQGKSWGKDHDDGHTSQDWDRFIRPRLAEFYEDDTPKWRRRELLVHIAALALAALEADDRGGLALQT